MHVGVFGAHMEHRKTHVKGNQAWDKTETKVRQKTRPCDLSRRVKTVAKVRQFSAFCARAICLNQALCKLRIVGIFFPHMTDILAALPLCVP